MAENNGDKGKGKKGTSEEIAKVRAKNEATIDEILSSYKLPEVTVPIIIDVSLQYAILETEMELKAARAREGKTRSLAGSADIKEITERLEDLVEQASEKTRDFTFRALGRREFTQLKMAHPATEAQHKTWREEMGSRAPFNDETFPPALIAATCVDPVMTVEQATTICDDWAEPQVQDIFNGAWSVCGERMAIPLYKNVSARTMNSG